MAGNVNYKLYVCNAKYPILKDVSWCAAEGGYSYPELTIHFPCTIFWSWLCKLFDLKSLEEQFSPQKS